MSAREWVFRWCHLFDTHPAMFHLDESGTIVWLESYKIAWILWFESWKQISWFIWNPVVSALEQAMPADEKMEILSELNISYSGRIQRLIDKWNTVQMAA